jgi:hypothetical protein
LRHSASTIALALAAGMLSALSPAASAATSTAPARATAAPRAEGKFGVRRGAVPRGEADNPRAYRYIIDYLPTETVIHRRILIVNGEQKTARFSVYPDAAYISDGSFTGYSGATRSELTNWISVRHPSVTLAAGASALDTITISVPKGATRGEHYGVIWVQQAAAPRTGAGIGVTEVSRVGVRLYLAVGRGGAPPTSFDITSLAGRMTAAGQPYIVARVNNTGGRALDLNGSVRLTNGPGNTSSGPFPARQIVTIAPGQSWTMTFPLPKTLPQGFWRAQVMLASGLTTATATAVVRLEPAAASPAGLSAMQWIWLGLFAFAVILALVMGRYAWRHRRAVPV